MTAAADPVLHVIAGPNGAGKTTFYVSVVEPVTHLPFTNADLAEDRARRIEARESFVTETVFSHESKITLLRDAREAGYRVVLHIVLIPEELAVARVAQPVANGGHDVPENKVRARYARLWRHLRAAIPLAGEAFVYDNTRAAESFRLVASFVDGQVIGSPEWPSWTPSDLRDAGR